MKPFIMYIVGISGSGKTTIASTLTEVLRGKGIRNLQFIDGDDIRRELGGLFGYTFEERMKNNRVVCVIADYLVRNNINVILAQVGGYQAMRDQVKECVGGEYIEVYIKCSLEECKRRDVKGYYKKVQDNELDNLNGSNASFEVPSNCDLVIDSEKTNVDDAVAQILDLLKLKTYL